MSEGPERPLNVPPPERPLAGPREGWERVWIPVTVVLVILLVIAMRAILGTGEPWAECQLSYIEAQTSADSAAVDTIRVGPNGERTCGGIRIQRR
jgi:hypothetical protein